MPCLIRSVRAKPGEGLSHPIGAELISRLLAGVPQFDELDIWFPRQPGDRLGLFTPHRGQSRRLQGSAARDLLGFNEFLDCSWPFWGRWNIMVRPVPQSQRRDFSELSSSIGLPAIRSWLETPRSQTWFEGRHVLQIGADADRIRVAFLETHNDQIIEQRQVTRFGGGDAA